MATKTPTKKLSLENLKAQPELKNLPEVIVIPLDNGKITGKSKFNLGDLLFKMNSNLKHVLYTKVLENLGITIYEGKLYDAGQTKARSYFEQWLEQKARHESALMGEKTAIAKD
jgi:hypothetical protein